MKNTIRLLGAVAIEIDGAPAHAAFLRPRKVALLSCLLTAGRPVHRLELARMLWPDVDAKRARGSLNQLLVEMRREYGAGAILNHGEDAIVIPTGLFDCDVTDLERAAAAGQHALVLTLFRGAFLEGFATQELDALDDWIDRTRTRISEVVVDSALRVAASSDTSASDASASLRIAADLRPYDEAILRRRMELAAATAGAAAAAALYETHRARIAEQLGIAPSPETRKLLFALCAHQDAPADSAPTQIEQIAKLARERVAQLTPVSSMPVRPSASKPQRTHHFTRIAAAVAFAATGLIGIHAITREHAGASHSIDVALMSFGDQSKPAIRTLPGLVATYLIRDSLIDVTQADGTGAFQVVADLSSDKDEIAGTVRILNHGSLVASTAVRTSAHLGMDTIAAQLARYVSDVIRPVESYASPALALNAARQHLMYAQADYARGVRENAAFELSRAELQLDSIGGRARNDDWNNVSSAVARERERQQRGE